MNNSLSIKNSNIPMNNSLNIKNSNIPTNNSLNIKNSNIPMNNSLNIKNSNIPTNNSLNIKNSNIPMNNSLHTSHISDDCDCWGIWNLSPIWNCGSFLCPFKRHFMVVNPIYLPCTCITLTIDGCQDDNFIVTNNTNCCRLDDYNAASNDKVSIMTTLCFQQSFDFSLSERCLVLFSL